MINLVASSALLSLLIGLPVHTESFVSPHARRVGALFPSRTTILKSKSHRQEDFQLHGDNDDIDSDAITNYNNNKNLSRRSMFEHGSKLLSLPILLNSMHIEKANAIVGSLPEFSDTNGVLQGITIDVADLTQKEDMINFLRDGLSFKVLRQRKLNFVTETWMGYGPEEMKIPDTFEMPVSSFGQYGGHASICIRYDSQAIDLYYKKGDSNPPGNSIAFLQVGVPEYRISQMVKNGGNILDAYGIVNVISPSGLPMRAIVGISPDPIMFVALNCQNMKESRQFYEQLGFVEQEYPFCRPNKGMGQFEPPQPKNSIYLAPSANSMGVLLLQADRKIRNNIKPNPMFRSMNIVYTPPEGTDVSNADGMKALDPAGTAVSFQPYELFERTELSTRVVATKED